MSLSVTTVCPASTTVLSSVQFSTQELFRDSNLHGMGVELKLHFKKPYVASSETNLCLGDHKFMWHAFGGETVRD